MTIGIKVFNGIPDKTMQEQVDAWLKEEKPTDITFMAASESPSNEKDHYAYVSRALYIAYEK